jgi:hypothetical protein
MWRGKFHSHGQKLKLHRISIQQWLQQAYTCPSVTDEGYVGACTAHLLRVSNGNGILKHSFTILHIPTSNLKENYCDACHYKLKVIIITEWTQEHILLHSIFSSSSDKNSLSTGNISEVIADYKFLILLNGDA